MRSNQIKEDAGTSSSDEVVRSFLPGEFVRIGSTGAAFLGDLEKAAEQFRIFRVIGISGFLDPAFLATLQRLCDAGTFVPGASPVGLREEESPPRVGWALNLALRHRPLLRWLEAVTRCGPLSSVEGFVKQTYSKPGNDLVWHDDLNAPNRRLAITINLGNAPFSGGEFELRRKGGPTLLQHKYTTAGSALIFGVGPRLEHRVLPMTEGGPRRVYAGWALGVDKP